jgi:hypothetical protein
MHRRGVLDMLEKSEGNFVMFYVGWFSCLVQGSLLGDF